MASMVIQDIAKSTLGVVVAQQLDLGKRLDFGDSFALRHGSNGAIYFLISDAINYVTNGSSKLLSGNVFGIVDDTLFLGALSGASELTHLDQMLHDTLGTVTTDRKVLSTLVDSVIVSSGRILADYIDSTSLPTYVHAIRHPTLLLKK